jgi:hypothetical protein
MHNPEAVGKTIPLYAAAEPVAPAAQVSEREAAEQAYMKTAFDYAKEPVGSRDWCLFFDGWRAALRTEAK